MVKCRRHNEHFLKKKNVKVATHPVSTIRDMPD